MLLSARLPLSGRAIATRRSVYLSVCHTREPRLKRFKISKFILHHTI